VPVPTANESAYENTCSNQGGTPGKACPTMGLVGCCKLPGNEECYYGGGGDASQLQMECVMNSGATWSTSP